MYERKYTEEMDVFKQNLHHLSLQEKVALTDDLVKIWGEDIAELKALATQIETGDFLAGEYDELVADLKARVQDSEALRERIAWAHAVVKLNLNMEDKDD